MGVPFLPFSCGFVVVVDFVDNGSVKSGRRQESREEIVWMMVEYYGREEGKSTEQRYK